MDYLETLELAALVCGVDSWADDFDESEIDQLLYDKFEISFENFEKVASELIKLTPAVETALGGNKYRGFVHDGAFVVKEEV